MFPRDVLEAENCWATRSLLTPAQPGTNGGASEAGELAGHPKVHLSLSSKMKAMGV